MKVTREEKIRNHCQDRALEWFSASVMVVWALVLVAPGDTLSGPQFSAFARHGMTEIGWALAFGAIGAARFAALFINGRWPRTPYVRMAGSLFGAVSWAQVAWLLMEGTYLRNGVLNTGTGMYALLALAELVSIFRAAFDARYYRDAGHHNR